MAGRKRAGKDGNELHDGAPRKIARIQAVSERPVTRLSTRHSLFNAVFLTTELLRNILGFLPMRDLLLAQRTCRKWRYVICQSKFMQQQLFFVPGDADVCWELIWMSAPAKLIKITMDEYQQKRETGYVFKSGAFNELLFK